MRVSVLQNEQQRLTHKLDAVKAGTQHRFRIALDPRGLQLLPTASTCFNHLYLPEYANAAELRAKLQQAIVGAQGFHEGAVAQ